MKLQMYRRGEHVFPLLPAEGEPKQKFLILYDPGKQPDQTKPVLLWATAYRTTPGHFDLVISETYFGCEASHMVFDDQVVVWVPLPPNAEAPVWAELSGKYSPGDVLPKPQKTRCRMTSMTIALRSLLAETPLLPGEGMKCRIAYPGNNRSKAITFIRRNDDGSLSLFDEENYAVDLPADFTEEPLEPATPAPIPGAPPKEFWDIRGDGLRHYTFLALLPKNKRYAIYIDEFLQEPVRKYIAQIKEWQLTKESAFRQLRTWLQAAYMEVCRELHEGRAHTFTFNEGAKRGYTSMFDSPIPVPTYTAYSLLDGSILFPLPISVTPSGFRVEADIDTPFKIIFV